MQNEKSIRKLIERNLRKEIHPGTKPSIDFIMKVLTDAKESGMDYDVSDMRQKVLTFAMKSTHQADYCINLVQEMPFSSESDHEETYELPDDDTPIIFDVEVFPNLFLVNWKVRGADKIQRMINPTPNEISDLAEKRLVGFNNRRYDNHILYGRILGYSNEQLYHLSRKIISNLIKEGFREAYNLSYTDIYDFAAKKQSLKKWEIELGIHHKELGLPGTNRCRRSSGRRSPHIAITTSSPQRRSGTIWRRTGRRVRSSHRSRVYLSTPAPTS